MDVSVYPTELITPSTQGFPLHQVKSDTRSRVILEHSSVATLEDRGPTFTNGILGKRRQKRILKNCIECNTAHRRCVFESAGNVQCIRCIKFNLCCKFRYSGMCVTCYNIFLSNYFVSVINVYYCFFFTLQNKAVGMTSTSKNYVQVCLSPLTNICLLPLMSVVIVFTAMP